MAAETRPGRPDVAADTLVTSLRARKRPGCVFSRGAQILLRGAPRQICERAATQAVLHSGDAPRVRRLNWASILSRQLGRSEWSIRRTLRWRSSHLIWETKLSSPTLPRAWSSWRSGVGLRSGSALFVAFRPPNLRSARPRTYPGAPSVVRNCARPDFVSQIRWELRHRKVRRMCHSIRPRRRLRMLAVHSLRTRDASPEWHTRTRPALQLSRRSAEEREDFGNYVLPMAQRWKLAGSATSTAQGRTDGAGARVNTRRQQKRKHMSRDARGCWAQHRASQRRAWRRRKLASIDARIIERSSSKVENTKCSPKTQRIKCPPNAQRF